MPLLKKLRNRFFALFMSVFLALIIGVFAVIYIGTYHTIQREIDTRLEAGKFLWSDMQADEMFDPLLVQINLSETGEVTHINSMLDIPPDILEQMVGLVAETFPPMQVEVIEHGSYESSLRMWDVTSDVEDMTSASIHAGGREWRFVSSAASFRSTVDADGNIVHTETEAKLIFLDVTEYTQTLSSLVHTLLILGLVLLPLIAGISFFFSNRAVKPIATAWEKQKQFIADASHELKTPITILKSNLGIVMSNPGETVGEQMEWLGYVEAGANRMSKLASDLLSLANADRPDLGIQKETFDLSGAITGLVYTMGAKADEKGIAFATSIQPDVTLCSDREKLIQIATILLDNAIKHAEANGTVSISLIRCNQRISLAVTNGGRGIKAAEIPNVFDRFYQTEPSRNSGNEGFGLGLPIAKALTDKLGGSLSVTSGENEATTFTFIVD
ncbi:MAG: HAMP domain-containing histidine kinase [Oscillospiraceae bacterium]|nr:HAMP domain-containing histidine kinase [Oscillospiraceae bacterium]